MSIIIDTEKVVEVFCCIDDFCKEVESFYATHPLPEGLHQRNSRGRRPSLSESEVLAILVLYHLSGFKPSRSDALSTTTKDWYCRS